MIDRVLNDIELQRILYVGTKLTDISKKKTKQKLLTYPLVKFLVALPQNKHVLVITLRENILQRHSLLHSMLPRGVDAHCNFSTIRFKCILTQILISIAYSVIIYQQSFVSFFHPCSSIKPP